MYFAFLHGLFRRRVLDDQLHLFGVIVRFLRDCILRFGVVDGSHDRVQCDLRRFEDVLFLLWVVVSVDNLKRRVLGVSVGGRQMLVVFLVVNEIGVNVFAEVGRVVPFPFELFLNALFGKKGGLVATLLFAFLAQLLEIVERKIELVDRENQEQEGEDDDYTGVAYILGKDVVEPLANRATENGTFRCGSGDESEEQRQPYQTKECPFPDAPHFDFSRVVQS